MINGKCEFLPLTIFVKVFDCRYLHNSDSIPLNLYFINNLGILKNKWLSSMLTTLRKLSFFKIYLDHNFNNSCEISEEFMKSDESFYIKKICLMLTFNSLSYGQNVINMLLTLIKHLTKTLLIQKVVTLSF